MMNGKPLLIDGFCGLGGATEGFQSEGWECVGFDNERHDYGNGGYPGQLVVQDILTVHGSQFRDGDFLWFSPPCTEFSYMAMPWSRAKQIAKALRGQGEFPVEYDGSRTLPELKVFWYACIRIHIEACHAAKRYIPMVVENVRGAQPWVGRANANYGSFYLWGDVRQVGRRIVGIRPQFGEGLKVGGGRKVVKVSGLNWSNYGEPGYKAQGFNGTAARRYRDARRNDQRKDMRILPSGAGQADEVCLRADGAVEDGRDSMQMREMAHPAAGSLGLCEGDDSTSQAGRSCGMSGDAGLKTSTHVNIRDGHSHTRHLTNQREHDGIKRPDNGYTGMSGWGNGHTGSGKKTKTQTDVFRENQANINTEDGTKFHISGHAWYRQGQGAVSSKSDSRKAASAQIAKIPLPLSRFLARIYKPDLTAVIP